MELVLDNCFVVFKRHEARQIGNPELVEEPLAACGSYAEAKEILGQLQKTHQTGVIRFQGDTGGGD